MRITLGIADELVRQAKRRAADEGIALRAVFEAALRSYLSRRSRRSDAYQLRWRTEKGRLLPGVDLDDREKLFDLTEDNQS